MLTYSSTITPLGFKDIVLKTKRIALVGNPNSGKTTLFNAITGANQHVGNWPGVTVEKKEGNFSYKGATYDVVDLPGDRKSTRLNSSH